MRRWGIVITFFYAMLLVLLAYPDWVALAEMSFTFQSFYSVYSGLLINWSEGWILWFMVAVLVTGQALLLFVSVDTSVRRLRPRRHVGLTVGLASLCAAILLSAAVWVFAAGLYGDKAFKLGLAPGGDDQAEIFAKAVQWWMGFWAVWALVFYLRLRDSPKPVSAAIAWLLKGSVLELLIAVPAHIVARQRGECSAPFATAYGIVTGIAIMLLCFGPGVLALYKKKYDVYRKINPMME